jgi:hypothetical protein
MTKDADLPHPALGQELTLSRATVPVTTEGCPLLGITRTSRSRTPKSGMTHMYGPAARLQEVFVDLVVSGLASMYPVSSWSCFAPDHHGYQRACVLISGQASIGPCGSPVFACAGKTGPPSLLIPLADLG